jgi:hypothetical protein
VAVEIAADPAPFHEVGRCLGRRTLPELGRAIHDPELVEDRSLVPPVGKRPERLHVLGRAGGAQ